MGDVRPPFPMVPPFFMFAVCYKILKTKLRALGMDCQQTSELLFLQGAVKGVSVPEVASFYLGMVSSLPR